MKGGMAEPDAGAGVGGDWAPSERPALREMESLSAERQEMVQRLMSSAGIEDPELAREFLQDNGWQLEQAVGACLPALEAAAAMRLHSAQRWGIPGRTASTRGCFSMSTPSLAPTMAPRGASILRNRRRLPT